MSVKKQFERWGTELNIRRMINTLYRLEKEADTAIRDSNPVAAYNARLLVLAIREHCNTLMETLNKISSPHE